MGSDRAHRRPGGRVGAIAKSFFGQELRAVAAMMPAMIFRFASLEPWYARPRANTFRGSATRALIHTIQTDSITSEDFIQGPPDRVLDLHTDSFFYTAPYLTLTQCCQCAHHFS